MDYNMLASLVANGAASASQRQEFAQAQMRGNDARGGLLGRLAGSRKGGAIKENDGVPNAGSAEFRALSGQQASQDAYMKGIEDGTGLF